MIPKIIHYCWVGNCQKPKSVLYCIESWRKFCPDYRIIEWNESNYDFSKNKYMWQAYEAKKWGFVPDYARLDIVYQYGGIYLDTDVELVKNIDELLSHKAFMGFEDTGDGEFFVNCGHGFGAEPGNEITKTVTINSNKTGKIVLKGLTSRKNYYVRVRSCKVVNGKAIWGSYSKATKMKVK